MFPDYKHNIPHQSDVTITIEKLERSYLTTDTCNAARKTRQLFKERIVAACAQTTETPTEIIAPKEVDCQQHLQNIVSGGLAKKSMHTTGQN